MIEGKEDGFARKRKARDKANLRLIKNQHLIVPSIILLYVMGALLSGTVALSFLDPLSSGFIAATCGMAAVAIFGNKVIHELTK